MKNKIAFIENGKVSNIIICDQDIANSIGIDYVDITNIDYVKIGDNYSDGNFEEVPVDTGLVVEAPAETISRLTNDPDEEVVEEAPVLTKLNEEINWRDSELKNTSHMASMTDHPQYIQYMKYIEDLINYPDTEDFPNGIRPSVPQ